MSGDAPSEPPPCRGVPVGCLPEPSHRCGARGSSRCPWSRTARCDAEGCDRAPAVRGSLSQGRQPHGPGKTTGIFSLRSVQHAKSHHSARASSGSRRPQDVPPPNPVFRLAPSSNPSAPPFFHLFPHRRSFSSFPSSAPTCAARATTMKNSASTGAAYGRQ